MTIAMTTQTMPEFYGGYAEIERKQNEWRKNHAELDAYVTIGVRHSAEMLLLYDGKSLERLEQTLGRSFQTEVESLRSKPAMMIYLRNISKYDPSIRIARLSEVAASRQNLIDQPTEETLLRYQKALSKKPSAVEVALFQAQSQLGLSDDQLDTDLKLIQEAETLEKELADDILVKTETQHQELLNEMTRLRAELLTTGVVCHTDRQWQQLVFKTNAVGNEKAKLQRKSERLAELRTFEIICHDSNK